MTDHNLRYYAVGFGSGLVALGGILSHFGSTLPQEFWAGTAVIYGIALMDAIKHRNNT